jgi:hypothetical protein
MGGWVGLTRDGSLRPLPRWRRQVEVTAEVVVLKMLMIGSCPHPRGDDADALLGWEHDMVETVAGWTADERRYAEWWLDAEVLLAADNVGVSHPGTVPPKLAELGFRR